MKYDFDQIISRKETFSTKWLKFTNDDVIPMWIADMDFICPPEITSAMSERIAQGIFGYSEIPNNLTDVFVDNVKNNTGWSIEKDWVVWIPGGVVGLNVTCKTVLAPGEIAMVPSPIYAPFTEAPENMERGFIKTHLFDSQGRLEFDMDAIETLLTEDTKLFFLGRSYHLNLTNLACLTYRKFPLRINFSIRCMMHVKMQLASEQF